MLIYASVTDYIDFASHGKRRDTQDSSRYFKDLNPSRFFCVTQHMILQKISTVIKKRNQAFIEHPAIRVAPKVSVIANQ